TVGNIHSGTLSWTTRSGTARVNDVVDSGRKRSSPPAVFPEKTRRVTRLASIDEMMEVVRQWHEAAQPREQHENKPIESKPMEMGYNPATRNIEPIEPGDIGARADHDPEVQI